MKLHKEYLIRDIIKCVDVLPWLVTLDGCVSLYKRDSYFLNRSLLEFRKYETFD